MTPRRLVLRTHAQADISRNARHLARERGGAFAANWTNTLRSKLERIAAGEAQIGTAHPTRANLRTFGYQSNTTILAEFTDDELRIIRVYFGGQNWS